MKAIRYFIIITLLLIIQQYIYSQSGVWTWMNGDNTVNYYGTFGIKGVPSTNNTPPSLYEACQWTDLEGNFWLYGVNSTNTLWKFNPITNEWTWVSGTNAFGVAYYGIQGVPSVNNSPGARSYCIATWTDTIGDLWMLGGQDNNADCSNALWRYNIVSNQWTWMKGSNLPNQTGVYGTKGIPSPANTPSARHETNGTWVTGKYLWLYGGRNDNESIGSDLWRYDITTNEWAWMKGEYQNTQPIVYGTKGVEDSLNSPGSRWVYCSWKDDCNNLWLFGGFGGFGNYYYYNDVWKYNIQTNNWTWESGSNLPNNPGINNGYCNASINNCPSGRCENRACWNDKCGNLWMFGGQNEILGESYLNDLWHFNSTSKKWTLVSGTLLRNQTGVFGTKTIPNPSNMPGGRSGALSWMDLQGNLWLFGGVNSPVNKNDLWRFVPDSNCQPYSCPKISNNKEICKGDSTILSVSGGISYLWNTGDTASSIIVHPLTSTNYYVKINTLNGCSIYLSVKVIINIPESLLGNDTTLCQGQILILNASCPNSTYYWQDGSTNPSFTVSQQGVYWVRITDNNCNNSDTIHITYDSPFSINLGSDTTICSGSFVLLVATNPNSTYQWQDNSSNQFYSVTKEGTYWVKVTDFNKCSVIDTISILVKDCEINLVIPNIITPNNDGVNDYFMIKGADNCNLQIEIYNRWGIKLYVNNNYQNNWNGKDLSDGVYYYIIKASNKNNVKVNEYHGSLTILR